MDSTMPVFVGKIREIMSYAGDRKMHRRKR
jgi:hypothetical protein